MDFKDFGPFKTLIPNFSVSTFVFSFLPLLAMLRTKHAQRQAEEARSSILAVDASMGELSNQFLSAEY